MGMILFLLLACGLPGLIFLYIRQSIPDDAWSGQAVGARMHTVPPKPFGRYRGYLGGLKDEGSACQNSDKSLSVHGADIEHGLTSNITRTDEKERSAGGMAHTGGDLETPAATDPTGIGPPPAGAKISPDGTVASEIPGTGASPDKAQT
jgi:hypothetical protein